MDLSVNKAINLFIFQLGIHRRYLNKWKPIQPIFLTAAQHRRRCRKYTPENNSSTHTSDADSSSGDTGSSEENHSDEESQ